MLGWQCWRQRWWHRRSVLSWTRQDWLGLKIDQSSVCGQDWWCSSLEMLYFIIIFFFILCDSRCTDIKLEHLEMEGKCNEAKENCFSLNPVRKQQADSSCSLWYTPDTTSLRFSGNTVADLGPAHKDKWITTHRSPGFWTPGFLKSTRN